LNNYWTFRWRKTKGRVRIKGLKFNLVSLVALGVSYGMFIALSMGFPDVVPQAHQLIGIVPATLVNYFLNSYWTFQHVKAPKNTVAESISSEPFLDLASRNQGIFETGRAAKSVMIEG